MARTDRRVSRRRLLQGAAAAVSGALVLPRRVLGGPGTEEVPPSDQIGGALIGCGGRGGGTFGNFGKAVRKLADCDVRFFDKADQQKTYSDFRRLLERKDIEVVAIATHPGWHALISIAAMEAGKDVLCEKPMTRFIAEGRAVVEAERRYRRIFQIGTFGRFGASQDKRNIQIHKIMSSGLLKECKGVHIKKGGLKVKEWSGYVNARPQPVPKWLDWNLYCGPSPLRPYHGHRFGGTHRGYWDYEGGGMSDMGQHHFDPVQWIFAKDGTSPVEIEASAPPAHPEACGMWGWVELKYADGMTFVMVSDEWGPPYDRLKSRDVTLNDLDDEGKKTIAEMPAPEPMVDFITAVKTRKRSGGNAEAAHRCATLLHLANIAIRVGRKVRYDPVKEQIVGDDEANRLVNPPMRAPWRL